LSPDQGPGAHALTIVATAKSLVSHEIEWLFEVEETLNENFLYSIPPYFVPPLEQVQTKIIGEAWEYALPEMVDPSL